MLSEVASNRAPHHLSLQLMPTKILTPTSDLYPFSVPVAAAN